VNRNKIRKVLITDWNSTCNAMDTDTMLTYLALTGNLSAAVDEMETFKIVALLSLFSGENAGATKNLAQLEKKYETVLQRRIAAKRQVNFLI
jgi:hypothetical protein